MDGTRAALASGWPFLALWSSFELQPGFGQYGAYKARNGIVLSATPAKRWFEQSARADQVLPVRVVWYGFTLDVCVFAGVWWVLLSAPGKLRGALRARRGQCIACGYPRKGLGTTLECPECETHGYGDRRHAETW